MPGLSFVVGGCCPGGDLRCRYARRGGWGCPRTLNGVIATTVPQEPQPAERGTPRWRLGFWWRLVGSAAAGGLLFLSFPPRPLWWVAPVAFALFAATVYG